MDQNSQNYSALKTPISRGSKLPQIIVQMPVYKESLEEVRQPLANMPFLHGAGGSEGHPLWPLLQSLVATS